MNNNIFKDKKVAFTGGLKKLNRKNAFIKIMELGGFPVNHVNNNTDLLIVADEVKDSNIWTEKKEKCFNLKQQGAKIKTVSEEYFYNHL